MKASIKAKCQDCNGSGVQVFWTEVEGDAAVCVRCKGLGYTTIIYEPFTRRTDRDDVVNVYKSIDKQGVAKGDSITYEEFKAGKMPA